MHPNPTFLPVSTYPHFTPTASAEKNPPPKKNQLKMIQNKQTEKKPPCSSGFLTPLHSS